MHWSNADEQMIQTFKNNFIAGLCSVNLNFPLQLLDRLLDQATNTLNMVQKHRINQNIIPNEQLFGIFNFNRTPFAPPGTKILVHDKPENRATYDPHGSYEWYIGRVPLHHRCLKYYTTSTKSEKTSDTVDSPPHHFGMHKTSSAYASAIAA